MAFIESWLRAATAGESACDERLEHVSLGGALELHNSGANLGAS